MQNVSKTPLIIITYNRPNHLERLLESLSRNHELDKVDVFFFSDAAKCEEDFYKVRQVREVIYDFTHGDTARVFERKENIGLAENVQGAINTVLQEEQYDSFIVLEDDLVLNEYFLNFMLRGLEIYRGDPRIFHISGWSYPVRNSASQVRFLKMMNCWGWGSWRGKWKLYTSDQNVARTFMTNKHQLSEFNLDNSFPFEEHLAKNLKGEWRTWAIFWYMSMFMYDGYEVLPPKSLVINSGFDNSGTNSIRRLNYNAREKEIHDVEIEFIAFNPDREYRYLVKRFYKKKYNCFNSVIVKLINLKF